jgi:hypothetical protein
MTKIFISYRRNDVPDSVGRIADQLAGTFGHNDVFKDVDSIGPGVDFRTAVRSAIADCKFFLVAIGPGWVAAKDKDGAIRLNDPEDLVRIELEVAFERKLKVIPILVSGAEMPPPSALPESLRPLSYLNAVRIRHDPDFIPDTRKLIGALKSNAFWRPSRVVMAAALAAGLIATATVIVLWRPSPVPHPTDSSTSRIAKCKSVPFHDNSKMPPVVTSIEVCD